MLSGAGRAATGHEERLLVVTEQFRDRLKFRIREQHVVGREPSELVLCVRVSFACELCPQHVFNLAEVSVLAGTAVPLC